MNIKADDLDFNDKTTCLLLEHIEEQFYDEYKKSFVLIDGLSQHARGWSFDKWVDVAHPTYYLLLQAYSDWKSDMYDGVSE